MAEKLLKSAAWNRLLIELKIWRLKHWECDMAESVGPASIPGVCARSGHTRYKCYGAEDSD